MSVAEQHCISVWSNVVTVAAAFVWIMAKTHHGFDYMLNNWSNALRSFKAVARIRVVNMFTPTGRPNIADQLMTLAPSLRVTLRQGSANFLNRHPGVPRGILRGAAEYYRNFLYYLLGLKAFPYLNKTTTDLKIPKKNDFFSRDSELKTFFKAFPHLETTARNRRSWKKKLKNSQLAPKTTIYLKIRPETTFENLLISRFFHQKL